MGNQGGIYNFLKKKKNGGIYKNPWGEKIEEKRRQKSEKH